MQDRYDWGLVPKIFLFLKEEERKGAEFLSIANYKSALKQLEELEKMGLVEHRIEVGARGKTGHRYKLTAKGLEVAELIADIDAQLQMLYRSPSKG